MLKIDKLKQRYPRVSEPSLKDIILTLHDVRQGQITDLSIYLIL